LGDFGQLWGILGFSGLFLHKYAVYEGFLAIKYYFTVTISCKRVLSDTRIPPRTPFTRLPDACAVVVVADKYIFFVVYSPDCTSDVFTCSEKPRCCGGWASNARSGKLGGGAHAPITCLWMRASGGPGGHTWPRNESENGKRPGNGYILTHVRRPTEFRSRFQDVARAHLRTPWGAAIAAGGRTRGRSRCVWVCRAPLSKPGRSAMSPCDEKRGRVLSLLGTCRITEGRRRECSQHRDMWPIHGGAFADTSTRLGGRMGDDAGRGMCTSGRPKLYSSQRTMRTCLPL
jgi:hypothetical protein